MKKIILGLAIAISLMSCSGNESKMKSEIKSYLDKNAKDPKSYEFVDLKIIDTVVNGKLAQERISENDTLISNNLKSIETNKITLRKAESDKVKYNDSSFDEFIDGAKADIETAEAIIKNHKNDNEKYKKLLKSKEVLGYVAIHNYRLKNGFGALDIDKSYVVFDKDFKLLTFGEDTDLSIFK
ncbi:MAG: hypothetical protein H7Z76_13445 [Methylotenera sp.]|nr:hypothetical protein [Flavobacterium sp.]